MKFANVECRILRKIVIRDPQFVIAHALSVFLGIAIHIIIQVRVRKIFPNTTSRASQAYTFRNPEQTLHGDTRQFVLLS